MLEREPRLRLAASSSLTAAPGPVDHGPASRPAFSFDQPRETRLRRRIDSLLEQRARGHRRILALEDLLRIDGADERIAVLESRLKHLNRRIIVLREELREARAA